MKIGIDARLWNETGVGRYIRNLVRELDLLETDHEFVLFAQKKDKENIRRTVRGKNWSVIPVDIKWHTITEQFVFASVLHKENLDVMHFPYFSLPILYRRPFVVTIHDLIIHHFPTGKASTLPLPLYQMKRFGYEQVLQYAVKKGKKIIVPLSAVKKDLVNAYHVPEKKIAITPEGFDTGIVQVKNSKSLLPFTAYFLYVGNAYPHKNLQLLLKAFHEFSTRNPQASVGLVFVGKDDYFYKTMKEDTASGMEKNVVHLTNISDEELYLLYHNAIGLVSPSLMEGFGLTALEAIGTGCIPILSDIPAFHEVCAESAVYFNPTSPKSLLDKMEYVWKLSPADKKELRTKGAKRLPLFSWKKMAQETLVIYEACATKKL